jgi:Flp pilus assembly protein TadD
MTELAPPTQILRNIETLAERRAWAEAEEQAQQVTKSYPHTAVGWFLLGHVRRQRRDIAGARASAQQGLALSPTDRPLRLLSIELALQDWDVAKALNDLRALAADAGRDAILLQQIARLFNQLNLHVEAEQCHRRALATAPGNPEFLSNLAISAMALGKMEEAENLMDRVIASGPQDYNAYYNRATLKKQTPSRNHVAELEGLLARPLRNPVGEVQLCYALAKELEDLGEHRRSFAALKRGADALRRMLSYRVEDDVLTMEKMAKIFDPHFFARDIPGKKGPKPIFILGLPRSGTTLIDRILSSHSQIESLGEINRFAAAITRATPAPKDKSDLIAQFANADFAAAGKAYATATGAIAPQAARVIDKRPVNFIYLGLIARALPDATIIHVRRNPMDVCYAMYKTLFVRTYSFSYDFSDLAHYYLAYEKLMAHWRTVLPGRFIEVQYEDVVANQENVTRRLVADCGLAWEDACLTPERNERPSLTASAAQVRQKVYSSSVGLWRAYEEDLQPLARMLRDGGGDIDNG